MDLSRRQILAGIAAPAIRKPSGPDTDARIVEAAFRALHPGLLRYDTPAGLADRFGRLGAALSQATTAQAQWLALTRFTAGIRCGHTYVNPNNQKGAGAAFFAAGCDRLPFAFRWLGGRMIVTDPGPEGLRRGDEVLQIGPYAARGLLPRLMALAAADGSADGKRVRLSEVDRRELWPLPDPALPALAPQAFARPTTRLQVRGASGEIRDIVAPLLTRADRVAQRGSGDIVPAEAPAWTSQVLPDRSRLITMPTWALYNSRWDWAAWLDGEADAAIATGAPGLVLDLRGNSGGIECGDHLLARMIAAEVVRPDARRFVTYRRTPGELDPYLSTWDRSFRDWGPDAVGPDAAGRYRLNKWDADARGEVIRPRGRRYGGKLVAIIDAANSSATFQFAQTVKGNRLGALVGEATGGNRRGINGGAYFFLRLPQCGFTLDLPLVATFPTTPQPDAGILPDIPVATTAGDIAVGRDPQLPRAMAWIHRPQEGRAEIPRASPLAEPPSS